MNITPVTIIVVQGTGEAGVPAGVGAGPELQRSLFGPLDRLISVREQLGGLAARMPEPSAAMLENEAPYDLPTEIATTVQHVLHACIDPAVEKLRHLLAVTPEQLQQQWTAARVPTSD
jgi:hypothetical protein